MSSTEQERLASIIQAHDEGNETGAGLCFDPVTKMLWDNPGQAGKEAIAVAPSDLDHFERGARK